MSDVKPVEAIYAFENNLYKRMGPGRWFKMKTAYVKIPYEFQKMLERKISNSGNGDNDNDSKKQTQ